MNHDACANENVDSISVIFTASTCNKEQEWYSYCCIVSLLHCCNVTGSFSPSSQDSQRKLLTGDSKNQLLALTVSPPHELSPILSLKKTKWYYASGD
jgi:hypothetical protein